MKRNDVSYYLSVIVIKMRVCIRLLTTSPSALFFSSSLNFRTSSAIRASIITNDSRVKGRNKQRSSSDIELKSSIIVYMANDESLRMPRPAYAKTNNGINISHLISKCV